MCNHPSSENISPHIGSQGIPAGGSHLKLAFLCVKQRDWSLLIVGWQARHRRPKWAVKRWWPSCWLRVSGGLWESWGLWEAWLWQQIHATLLASSECPGYVGPGPDWAGAAMKVEVWFFVLGEGQQVATGVGTSTGHALNVMPAITGTAGCRRW